MSQDYLFNNCLSAGNDLFTIIETSQGMTIHFYKNVLPNLEVGDYVNFIAPLRSPSYKKMAYFISNKRIQKTKKAIIIPYLNDHFVMLNKRQNELCLSNFGSNIKDTIKSHVGY